MRQTERQRNRETIETERHREIGQKETDIQIITDNSIQIIGIYEPTNQ